MGTTETREERKYLKFSLQHLAVFLPEMSRLFVYVFVALTLCTFVTSKAMSDTSDMESSDLGLQKRGTCAKEHQACEKDADCCGGPYEFATCKALSYGKRCTVNRITSCPAEWRECNNHNDCCGGQLGCERFWFGARCFVCKDKNRQP